MKKIIARKKRERKREKNWKEIGERKREESE